MWSWLSGKKRQIGAAIMLVSQTGKLVAPEYAPIWEAIGYLGAAIAGVGFAHAGVKTIKKNTTVLDGGSDN